MGHPSRQRPRLSSLPTGRPMVPRRHLRLIDSKKCLVDSIDFFSKFAFLLNQIALAMKKVLLMLGALSLLVPPAAFAQAETIRPTVKITAPLNNAHVTSPGVQVVVSTADNVGVALVTLKI